MPRRLRAFAVCAFAVASLMCREARADILAPFIWSLSGAAVVLLPVIIVAEALVLRWLAHVTLLRAAWLALVVNLASTLVGVVLALVAAPFPAILVDLAAVPLFLAATVWMEGALLRRLARELAHVYRLSLRINLVSYAILLLGAAYIVHAQADAKREQRDRAMLNHAAVEPPVRPAPPPDGAAEPSRPPRSETMTR